MPVERSLLVAAALILASACTGSMDPSPRDGGAAAGADAEPRDAEPRDAGRPDAAVADAGVDAGLDGGVQAELAVLFFGNSYVTSNDVAGNTAAQLAADGRDVRLEVVAGGGRQLIQHANDAHTDGTPAARWLRTGTPEETAFDAVVLQEQSQIGGFPLYVPERQSSIDGALQLAELATARGARVVLYLTWGRALGDPSNGIIGYGTYLGMQGRLDEGYLSLATLLDEGGHDVTVAPVGGGFRLVYEDVLAAGGDPSAADSDFMALYQADGSHPSPRGAYLAACILARTIDPDLDAVVDHPELTTEVSARLREVCARAIVDPRWAVPRAARPSAAFGGEGDLGEQYGSDVALDREGRRLVVGVRGPPSAPERRAQVWVRTATTWSAEATWTGAGAFGSSVELDDDGAFAILRSPWAEYARAGEVWSPVVRAGAPMEGLGVSLSGDGRSAIVDRRSDQSTDVAARVLERGTDAWTEASLVVTDGLLGTGTVKALDVDGQRAIVGTAGSTLAYVFAKSGVDWSVEAALRSTHLDGDPGVARAVALSADGARAFVGLVDLDCVVVFERDGEVWSEREVVRGPSLSRFGAVIATTADGSMLLVGAAGDAHAAAARPSGSARLYEDDGERFVARRVLLPGAPPEGLGSLERFGEAVDLSADGAFAVVGSPGRPGPAGDYAGVAYVFALE